MPQVLAMFTVCFAAALPHLKMICRNLSVKVMALILALRATNISVSKIYQPAEKSEAAFFSLIARARICLIT